MSCVKIQKQMIKSSGLPRETPFLKGQKGRTCFLVTEYFHYYRWYNNVLAKWYKNMPLPFILGWKVTLYSTRISRDGTLTTKDGPIRSRCSALPIKLTSQLGAGRSCSLKANHSKTFDRVCTLVVPRCQHKFVYKLMQLRLHQKDVFRKSLTKLNGLVWT